jgi:hypothetical protein
MGTRSSFPRVKEEEEEVKNKKVAKFQMYIYKSITILSPQHGESSNCRGRWSPDMKGRCEYNEQTVSNS